MNDIHPTALIGPEVVMGRGNRIGPFVVITGRVQIGDGNVVHSHCILGADPEIRGGVEGEPSLRIGDRNIIREAAQLHAGASRGSVVGSDCYIMNRVYLAHDCNVGNGATIAGGVNAAGHVSIGSRANVGLGALVHQRRTIGDGAMVGMGAVVTRDVPAFVTAFGSPAKVRGVNRVGLERSGASPDFIRRFESAISGDDFELSLSLLTASGLVAPVGA